MDLNDKLQRGVVDNFDDGERRNLPRHGFLLCSY